MKMIFIGPEWVGRDPLAPTLDSPLFNLGILIPSIKIKNLYLNIELINSVNFIVIIQCSILFKRRPILHQAPVNSPPSHPFHALMKIIQSKEKHNQIRQPVHTHFHTLRCQSVHSALHSHILTISPFTHT